ncbi:DnaJ domain-containing protein [Sphingomonas sp. LaA6.9]|uniref:DnaJ domain-containing protein n=1 Tax=Sphingomonas sp. LaA6.9 TaxID=2919914 RepID=UPI001F4F6491|nr:DnaJ domain-containing protein [Sphingomonas sp. LaA6.9]MCJ8157271.1 J domain-containing protein [Sphingomonas sp. LaA6.9]
MAKLILLLGIVAIIWLWWKGHKAGPAMSPEEARLLLGVQPGAAPDEIRAAHRRIIARVHPDAGGSEELARKINAARDLLLKSGVQAPSQTD